MPFDEVRQVIEEEYDTRLERVFASFDRQPLGAASIAQAHAAVLRDGSPVVVKVQRQGIRDVMARDIQLLRKAARILKAASSAGNALDFGVILNEMWAVAQQEMDFLIEARNAGEFYKLNQDVAYVTCPQIHSQVTTSRVLVPPFSSSTLSSVTVMTRPSNFVSLESRFSKCAIMHPLLRRHHFRGSAPERGCILPCPLSGPPLPAL